MRRPLAVTLAAAAADFWLACRPAPARQGQPAARPVEAVTVETAQLGGDEIAAMIEAAFGAVAVCKSRRAQRFFVTLARRLDDVLAERDQAWLDYAARYSSNPFYDT